MIIKPMQPADWPEVQKIYIEGLQTGFATFETQTPEWEHWNNSHLVVGRLVACLEGLVVGWAALSPVSSRMCYAGVAEVSIYVSPRARGQRVGWALMQALIKSAEEGGFWMLQSSIFVENAASLALHEKAGFRMVGRRERIAQREGTWHDTFLLERRSAKNGVPQP
jgi:L-amino acid N-acyltransferase YncA